MYSKFDLEIGHLSLSFSVWLVEARYISPMRALVLDTERHIPNTMNVSWYCRIVGNYNCSSSSSFRPRGMAHSVVSSLSSHGLSGYAYLQILNASNREPGLAMHCCNVFNHSCSPQWRNMENIHARAFRTMVLFALNSVRHTESLWCPCCATSHAPCERSLYRLRYFGRSVNYTSFILH